MKKIKIPNKLTRMFLYKDLGTMNIAETTQATIIVMP